METSIQIIPVQFSGQFLPYIELTLPQTGKGALVICTPGEGFIWLSFEDDAGNQISSVHNFVATSMVNEVLAALGLAHRFPETLPAEGVAYVSANELEVMTALHACGFGTPTETWLRFRLDGQVMATPDLLPETGPVIVTSAEEALAVARQFMYQARTWLEEHMGQPIYIDIILKVMLWLAHLDGENVRPATLDHAGIYSMVSDPNTICVPVR